jgi:hypothetical protein
MEGGAGVQEVATMPPSRRLQPHAGPRATGEDSESPTKNRRPAEGRLSEKDQGLVGDGLHGVVSMASHPKLKDAAVAGLRRRGTVQEPAASSGHVFLLGSRADGSGRLSGPLSA